MNKSTWKNGTPKSRAIDRKRRPGKCVIPRGLSREERRRANYAAIASREVKLDPMIGKRRVNVLGEV